MLKRNVVICIASIIICLGGIVLAETVNINPHKIVLNAVGAFDDVQANVSIILPGVSVESFDVTLTLDDGDGNTVVAKAESACYCVDDNILIVGFDREALQNDIKEIPAMANKTVTATVVGSVTMDSGVTTDFEGSDSVEIVAPGKKG